MRAASPATPRSAPGRQARPCPVLMPAMLIALLACFAAPARADVVELNDGTAIEGTVAADTPDYVTIVTVSRKREVLSRSKIARVLKGWSILDLYAEKSAAAPRKEAPAQFELGSWCEKHKLRGLAWRHFRRAVAADPDFESARLALGHVRWEGAWYENERALMEAQGRGLFRGKWLTPEELENGREGFEEHGGDWFTPVEMKKIMEGGAVALPSGGERCVVRTLHYRLDTAVRASKSLKFALIAEQAWTKLKEFFGFEPAGILEGDIFGTLDDFEQYCISVGLSEPGMLRMHGFFDAGSGRIIFPFIEDDETSSIVLLHELCHQFEIMSGRCGRVPAWFFEGIACAFSQHTFRDCALSPWKLDPRNNINLYYLQHALRMGKAPRLAEILEGGPGAGFDPSFYHAAWGLAWFLMNRVESGYKEKFPRYREFLHSAESVRTGATEAFTSHFGPLEKVEDDFKKYILSIKGLPWMGEGRPVGGK